MSYDYCALCGSVVSCIRYDGRNSAYKRVQLAAVRTCDLRSHEVKGRLVSCCQASEINAMPLIGSFGGIPGWAKA